MADFSWILDSWGRIKKAQGADGGEEAYTYDYAGNVTGTEDAKGNKTSYRYNSQGKVCEITDQEGIRETFRYDREGRLILHTDRNQNQVRTSYHADGRPVCQSITSKTGERRVETWEYDSLGQLKKSVAGGICYTYQFRPDGKLLEKSRSGKKLVSCTWNPDGSLRSLCDDSGKTLYYQYDWCGRLKEISGENGEKIVSYDHTPGGKLAGIFYRNGIRTEYQYDARGNMIHLKTKTGTGGILADFAYEYDGNGNRIAKTGDYCRLLDTGKYGLEKLLLSYGYDEKNRLIKEDKEVVSGEKKTEADAVGYRYDECGNRLEKVENGKRTIYNYNTKNQLIRRETGEDSWKYEYDLQGNLTGEKGRRGTWKYTYDGKNRQEKILGPDGKNITYTYDGEGLRAEKEIDGKRSRFLYLNGELLSEREEGEDSFRRYVRGYGVAELENGNGCYGVHQDERGSTAYVTGIDGEICNSYEYDEFGVLRGGRETGPGCSQLYTGQQYDQETG